MKTRVLLACACVAVFSVASVHAAGEYRTIDVESLKITIDSVWAPKAAPGYLPVRFDIANLGEARVIEIVGQGSRWFRGVRGMQQGAISVRQTVRLARGDRVRLTIPVPIYADNENLRFEIREDGRTLERFNFVSLQSGSVPAAASALIVADLGSAFGQMAAAWARSSMTSPAFTTVGPAGRPVTSGGTRTPPPLDFVLDPPRLPANWLGFTSLRAVVIGPKEWEQLNAAQKDALLTWTACGGDLVFVDGDMSALLLARQNPPGGAEDRAVSGYFFGRIHLPTSASVSATGLAAVLSNAQKLQDANWALPVNGASDWGKIAARGFRLLIPGVDGVPARAYLLILIVFALWIGPLNYWLLWRKQRQVLLVLTVPLISAVFIVLLAGYVLAGEGLGVRGRAMTFTMLDQVRKQAATRASISLYAAGMTPAGGLRFDRDVAVFPLGPSGTGSRDQQTLDLTEAQRFSAGVIQARSPSNLELIGFRTARERLTFSRDGGGIGVVNGLGATIAALIYRDGDKIYSLARPLAAGARDVLNHGSPAAGIVVPSDLPLSARFTHLVGNQPRGSYLAVLEQSPFWDPGVSGISERSSFHLVIGWPEGQP